MPTGKKISDEKREIILKLDSQGLRVKQIAVQVGLDYDTVGDFLRKKRRRTRSKK